jgi:hypothetical protein
MHLTMVNVPIKTHLTHNASIKTLVIVDILFKLTLPIIVFSMHPLKHRPISSMPCKLQKKNISLQSNEIVQDKL